ncbi:hypothetical protein M3795_25150 [Ralstonia pickettii]|uniref:hypothetical protein n=1 Tax=Ralstonia pickettii TaxID=329 RepID=UPI00203E7956|nr:hypothetical protein [Ralstonia pickettii]MCM3583761.1 hypothetical protein [Ralstonia pickettii]
MAFQKEVGAGFRTQSDIAREALGERLGGLLSQLEAEIDRMKGLPDGEYRATDLHELESSLRRLAERAQVAGSPSFKQDK